MPSGPAPGFGAPVLLTGTTDRMGLAKRHIARERRARTRDTPNTVRTGPIPDELVGLLRAHRGTFGTGDGILRDQITSKLHRGRAALLKQVESRR